MDGGSGCFFVLARFLDAPGERGRFLDASGERARFSEGDVACLFTFFVVCAANVTGKAVAVGSFGLYADASAANATGRPVVKGRLTL